MNDEIKLYRVEVNTNLCFYVDVECADIEEAKSIAWDRAYAKSEELVGCGNDEEDMIYGIGQPEIGDVTDEDNNPIEDDDDEDEDDEEEYEEITDEPTVRSIEVFHEFVEQIKLTKGA